MDTNLQSLGDVSEKKWLLWRLALAVITVTGLVVTLLFAAPPQVAHAATDEDPSFVLTQNDLEFILRQIQVSEAHAADVLNPSNYELLCTDQGDAAQNCVSDEARPKGVRTVDGSFNNLRVTQSEYGASDNAFPRLLEAEWRQADPEELDLGFEANTPEQTAGCAAGTTCYGQTSGNVYDAQPREISNTIVDQSMDNPAIANQVQAGTAIPVPGTDRVVIPNTAPDEELSAPFNTFMGFFGQFFDHGLDLVGKGGSGTLIVPLSEGDPLYCPPSGQRPGETVECNPEANYITLSRASRMDETSPEHKNLTSPFIDQNQTYSSHPAHQVFLREYVLEGGVPVETGRLIEGDTGGMAKWKDVKAQARDILGLEITDADLLDVPQIAVDPYGNFVPGPNGYPQYVTGSGFVSGAPGGVEVPNDVLGTGHAFLDDISHGSTPVVDPGSGDLLPRFNEDGTPVLDENGEPVLSGYDNATLDEHYIAGDGRVNENIGLTAVHAVFHAEHNRMVDQILQVLNGERPELEAQDSAERGGITEFVKAFRGEAHSYVSDKPEENLPGYFPAGGSPASLPANWDQDDWSFTERLFQAAKFATEMQYQHLVFEEFGRKVSPNLDAVVFNENSYNPSIDPSITAEFAHVVYRFGHSMMTEEIGRESTEGGQAMQDIPLLTGFLNPTLFDENGSLSSEEAAGSLINGMTGRVGSQIDEHIVDVLRNNLLGLPLDLATLNLLRGRDTGVPGLQEARRTFFDATGDTTLAPYSSWDDFGRNIKNGNNFGRAGERASLVNFMAAYGTHPSIQEATTIEDKRIAAALLVNGSLPGEEFVIRHSGSDRFQTAALVSQRQFPEAGPVPVVYITNGYNFPDGLAAAAAARAEGGPLLLVAHSAEGEIPSATAAELTRLQPERIVVLGGPTTVSTATIANMSEYATSGAVDVIAGTNRFHTAALISQRFADPGVDRVFVVDGTNYPDALSVSAVAARDGSPVLLTTPTALPPATAAELARLAPDEIVIVGGTPSVSAAVQTAVAAHGDTRRIAGVNRYDTAVKVSQEFYPDGAETAFVTTGLNFPDALAAGPAAGVAGGPLLLTQPTALAAGTVAELQRLGVQQVQIVGSPSSVSADVEAQIAALAPPIVAAPADREDFLFSTGAWAAQETGLDNVDFWVGGLAERLDPFGGMLGSTFNFVFETQLEKLQFGDRFYYLFRNEGEQLFAALEGNTFSDIIQRNTDASNLPADIFALQDPIVDIDEQAALPAGQREPGLSLVGGQWRWQGDEHVEMHGTAGNDNLRGDEGDDSIWGYSGRDRIEGGAGNDALVGGAGDDIITDSFGDDNLKGKQGDDAINVGGGIDLAIGGLGDDFMVNGGGDASTFFSGMGDDILLGTTGRMTVIGGEHDDWVEGSGHADLLQADNADQFQNDTLGGNDVVAGRLGNDDVEGEGGDDILIGNSGGTDRHHGGLGWDWLTYYGSSVGITADFAFNRVFEPNNPLPSRFDLLEALSGGSGNDTLRGPIAEPDDLSESEIELNQATEEAIDRIPGLSEMLRPVIQVDGEPVALGDFSLPFLRGTPEGDVDGVHKLIIAGPGSDMVEGRGGDDFLDGDKMLRVRLTDGTNFYNSASQLQSRVFAGTLDPGAINIVRDIVDDPNADLSTDTAYYANAFAEYTITPIGPLGSGYWRVSHVGAEEPEESNGNDVLHGFERLQFLNGCAELSEDGTSWTSCTVDAAVTMTPTEPIEAQPVTANVWAADAAGAPTEVPFDLQAVTNLRYTWWGGEGETVETVTEWEELPNPLGTGSGIYVPDQAAVGLLLRVTASWTAADGSFATATSPVSDAAVAEGPSGPGTLLIDHADPLQPGALILVGTPSDPDGGISEEGELTYAWSWTATDPNAPGAEPEWTPYPPEAIVPPGTAYTPQSTDVGRWIRVTVSYLDGAQNPDEASAWTSVPVTLP
ncbi:peroxidase family protein [Microbacterium sp. zg-YB36]|uniref:peroxidase family protein n=1 Tax=Microbacterium sp. zg-YB36 TaxID=2969407 RepID=UPI00214C7FF1|nr:peroxidase family protein [Microbacterium sp. zg-YB36]MDL5352751.1 peroxidase family protein [Microbacterium sp. zg-YB36]